MAPVTERSRVSRLALPALTAGAVGAAVLALRLRDPHVGGSWGFCPFKALTGWDCPGCGGLRAVNDLTHLDLASAASSNLFVVLALPLAVLAWVVWARRSWRGAEPTVPRHPGLALSLGQAVLVLAVVFAVVRNLPVGGWLAA